MKRAILVCLIWMLVFGVIQQPSISAQSPTESDAPYIYYYSDLLNAFVIERADGTDSRTLGDGLIPEDTNTIAGPGWSPSGEWFAWTAASVGGYGQTLRAFQPDVVHISGEQHVTILDDVHDTRMVWHPTEDLLFVAGVTTDTDYADFDPENVHIRLVIIDPATNSAVTSLETVRSALSSDYQESVPLIQWVDEDHAIAFYDEKVSQEPYEIRSTVHTLDRYGNTSTHSLPYITRAQGGWFPTVSSAGYVAYFAAPDDENIVTFENVVTGNMVEVETNFNRIWAMEWNADGTSGTAYADDLTCRGAEYKEVLWTFSVDGGFERANTGGFYDTDQTTTLERQCDYDSPQFTIWLPAFDRERQIQTVAVYECDSFELIGEYTFDEPIWQIDNSSDGRYLTHVNDHIVVFDAEINAQMDIAPDSRSYNSVSGGYTLWHPQEAWFFTMENSGIASGGGGPLWIGIATPDGTVNRDLTLCDYAEPCIGWLPEKVNISLLPSGQSTPVIHEANRVIHGTDWTFYLSWSPDGQRIVSAMEYFGEGSRDSVLLDVESGETIATLSGIDYQQEIDWIQSADGTYAPTIVPRNNNLPQIGRWTWAISPNGQLAVVELDDRSGVVVYDIEAESTVLELGRTGYPLAIFSPDNRYVIFSGAYRRLQIWDIDTGEIVVQLNTNATALAFSPDGQTLAVASSWDIQLWDVERLISGDN